MSERRRAALKQKRIRQVKRQIAMICVGLAAVMIVIGVFILKPGKKETVSGDESVEKEVVQQEETETLETENKPEEVPETPEERLKRVKEEAKTAGYPEKVIKLLDKNPETIDFVEAYGEKKDIASPEVIAELKEGEIPRLIQWDERWGYASYGTGIVAVCGCGPTTLSMVLSGLTGDNTLTPAMLAEYGTEHHYLNEKNDTMWSYMTDVCKEWGVNCREAVLDKAEVLKELDEGHPIVCSVGPGDFTQNGHFILLAGLKGEELIVHDPFSIANSEKTWKFEDIQDQIKVMWVYSK